MSAKVTVKADLSTLNQMAMEAASQLALEVAQNHIVLLRQRVALGVNAEDRRMPAYSDQYAKFKRKKGRRVEVRNLSFSNRMLNDLHAVQSSPGVAQVLFATRPQLMKGIYNQRISPWFGISPRDADAHEAYIKSQGIG